MDWSTLNIHFSMEDVINGALQIMESFFPLVWVSIGISLALFGLQGLFFLFVKHESFFPWDR